MCGRWAPTVRMNLPGSWYRARAAATAPGVTAVKGRMFDAVRHQGGTGGRRVVLTDLGQAGLTRGRDRGRPPEHGPGGQLQPRLAGPAAGEAHVALDRAVVDGHHDRARADERRERRVRHVRRGGSRRAEQAREFPAAVHGSQRDVGVDDLCVRGQPGQREDLLAAAVDEHPQGKPVLGRGHVRRQLHDRAGDPVRAGKRVDPRVDQDRAICRHVPASLSIPRAPCPPRGPVRRVRAVPRAPRPVRGPVPHFRAVPRTRPPSVPAREPLCPHH